MGKPNFFFNYTKTPSFSSSQWKAIRPLLILMLHQTKSKSCSTLAKEESHSPQLRIIRLADVLRNHQCLTQSLSSHQFFLRKNYGEPKMMPKEDKKKKKCVFTPLPNNLPLLYKKFSKVNLIARTISDGEFWFQKNWPRCSLFLSMDMSSHKTKDYWALKHNIQDLTNADGYNRLVEPKI